MNRNPFVEIPLAPKQLASMGHLNQQVTLLASSYNEVTSNDLALHSLVLPLKTMGITLSHQHLYQLPNFKVEVYAYPLFNMEQIVNLEEDTPSFVQVGNRPLQTRYATILMPLEPIRALILLP